MRWKLSAPHYLNVPGTDWEHKENDRNTGRLKRVMYPVPRFLDPRDPGDWTQSWGHRDMADGEIIVCYKGKGNASDIEFIGEPTPDMIPVDNEAKALSATFAEKWCYKPDLNQSSFSQSLIENMQKEMAVAETKPQAVEVAGLTELVASISKLVEHSAPRRV